VFISEGTMRTVSLREAEGAFSKLLSEVEAGEEIVITKDGRPVATIAPYKPPFMTPEREAAITRAAKIFKKGLRGSS
jgi:prevent-host-death family protein